MYKVLADVTSYCWMDHLFTLVVELFQQVDHIKEMDFPHFMKKIQHFTNNIIAIIFNPAAL